MCATYKHRFLGCRHFQVQVLPCLADILSAGSQSLNNGKLDRLLKYSKNRGVFCHVTHDEMAFLEVVCSIWWPCLFSAI